MAIQPDQLQTPRKSQVQRPRPKDPGALSREALKHLPAEAPQFVEPMMARLHNSLPRGQEWLYEVKLDGIRALIVKTSSQVRIWSRRPRDMTADYPELAKALSRLPARQFVVDGEIVALDPHGRSSF